MIWICVHCLRHLLCLNGEVQPCPEHPDGPYEQVEVDDEL
jgi:hypothetical protein